MPFQSGLWNNGLCKKEERKGRAKTLCLKSLEGGEGEGGERKEGPFSSGQERKKGLGGMGVAQVGDETN